MTEEEFKALVSRIQNSLACSKEMATEYASAIGDNPEVVHGKIMVRNERGLIIAYVPMSVLGCKSL